MFVIDKMACCALLSRAKRFQDAAVLLLVGLIVSASQCEASRRASRGGALSHYVVRLRSALPLAAYRGGLSVFPSGWTDDGPAGNSSLPAALTATPATVAAEARAFSGRRIPRRVRLTMDNPQIRAHAETLEYQQAKVAAAVGIPAENIAHRYKHALHGFAASMTPLQAHRLRRHPAVAAVNEEREVHLATTDSPTFLGMGSPGSLWPANGGQSKVGDGMVIAHIDSGIWPEHPAFNDSGFSTTRPAGWSGICQKTADFKCNNKIIGARIIYESFELVLDMNPGGSDDWLSPRDPDGHGTACAGASAGNMGVPMASGTASGMAPAARLAIYKACWMINGHRRCFFGDMMTAIDLAVADGVDVISIPLPMSNLGNYFDDMPMLYASMAGIVVVASAGNYGRPTSTTNQGYLMLDNLAPFYLTVGASSILREGVVLSKNQNRSGPAERPAPMIADFSSTGPACHPSYTSKDGYPTNNLLKPDIVGPGVDLYVASPGEKVGETGSYVQQSGTSIATAHLAGVAALILQKNPTWSPAQVMSAIMTTAITTDTDGYAIMDARFTNATPWAMGHGHVYPADVLDPGLTYDARAADYMNFLAGQNLVEAKTNFPKAKLVKMAATELNRPSIAVAGLKGTIKVTRTVTNAAATTTYKANVTAPSEISVVGSGEIHCDCKGEESNGGV